MAHHQVGDRLSVKDNRHKAVVKLLEQYRKVIFFNDFLDRYRDDFQLHDVPPSKALRSPFEAPSKPLRSQDQDQDQDQDQVVCVVGGPKPKPEPEPKPQSAERDPLEAWRDVAGCDPQAYEAWLEWRSSEHDPVPARVRLQDAKFLAPKGSPAQQREFIDRLIRLRFRRLHDPIEPRRNGGTARPESTPNQEAAKLRELMDGRAARGLSAFRDPTPVESAEVYATALRNEENRRGIKAGAPRFPKSAQRRG
jgi:hypothetical protein